MLRSPTENRSLVVFGKIYLRDEFVKSFVIEDGIISGREYPGF